MLLLVISDILALFFNIFIANHKYSPCNMDNLRESIQMQFSKKQKTFSEFFALFLKATSNFESFEKYHDPHILSISQITDREKHD